MNSLEEKRNLLKTKVQELFPAPGMLQTNIHGLSASLRTAPSFNQHCFYKPMAIIVLQGKKKRLLVLKTLYIVKINRSLPPLIFQL